MPMSPENIIMHAHNIPPNDIANMVVYYFTPIDDQTTQLHNMNDEIYNIPTNKLSDIHAILCTRHPKKNYHIKYKYPNTNDNILPIHSQPQYPNTIDIGRPNTYMKGYYTLNTERITPILCDNISIVQALDMMENQIQAQCAFMRLHPSTTYGYTDCTGRVQLFNHHNICIQYRIYNMRHSPNILVEINIYRPKSLHKIHQTHFCLAPDTVNNIDASITDTCNNILTHIQHNIAQYCNENDSQHHCIDLIRTASHYFAQPNHPLRASIRQGVHNIQKHYTYQS